MTKSLKGDETGRWLRTGDKGSVDTDGYLNLSGRFKEIINRGGEKISPFAIEVRRCPVLAFETFEPSHARGKASV